MKMPPIERSPQGLSNDKNLALITSQIRRESQIIADVVAKEEQDELTRVTDNTVKNIYRKRRNGKSNIF